MEVENGSHGETNELLCKKVALMMRVKYDR